MGVDMWTGLDGFDSRPCTDRLVVACAAPRSSTLWPRSIRCVCRRLFPFAAALRDGRASRGGRPAGSELSAPPMSPRASPRQPMLSLPPDHEETRIGENPCGRGASREDLRAALPARPFSAEPLRRRLSKENRPKDPVSAPAVTARIGEGRGTPPPARLLPVSGKLVSPLADSPTGHGQQPFFVDAPLTPACPQAAQSFRVSSGLTRTFRGRSLRASEPASGPVARPTGRCSSADGMTHEARGADGLTVASRSTRRRLPLDRDPEQARTLRVREAV